MEIIDYARPTMLAEKALRDMHNAMLERRYVDATNLLIDASQHLNDVMRAIIAERSLTRVTQERRNAGKAQDRP